MATNNKLTLQSLKELFDALSAQFEVVKNTLKQQSEDSQKLEKTVQKNSDQSDVLEANIASLYKKLEPPKEETTKPPSTPKATFEVRGKKYRFNAPKYIGAGGKLFLTQDVINNNPAELERLVSIRAGVIEAV